MIKLELPDDNVIVLTRMGEALVNIAKDLETNPFQRELPIKVEATTTVSPHHATASGTAIDIDHKDIEPGNVLTTVGAGVLTPVIDISSATEIDNQYGTLADDGVGTIATDDKTSVTLDSRGIPWDARIHSKNKTTVSGGVWRTMMKPKGYETTEQWKEYVSSVEAELLVAVNNTPPPPVDDTPWDNTPPPPADNTPPPPVDNTPPPPADNTPPPPADNTPPPPVDNTPPPPADNTPPPPVQVVQFPELMKLVTSNSAHNSVPKVQQIITDNNYGSLQTLNSVGPEAVGHVYQLLKEALNV